MCVLFCIKIIQKYEKIDHYDCEDACIIFSHMYYSIKSSLLHYPKIASVMPSSEKIERAKGHFSHGADREKKVRNEWKKTYPDIPWRESTIVCAG